jgi:hypothetical protein
MKSPLWDWGKWRTKSRLDPASIVGVVNGDEMEDIGVRGSQSRAKKALKRRRSSGASQMRHQSDRPMA